MFQESVHAEDNPDPPMKPTIHIEQKYNPRRRSRQHVRAETSLDGQSKIIYRKFVKNTERISSTSKLKNANLLVLSPKVVNIIPQFRAQRNRTRNKSCSQVTSSSGQLVSKMNVVSQKQLKKGTIENEMKLLKPMLENFQTPQKKSRNQRHRKNFHSQGEKSFFQKFDLLNFDPVEYS